MPKFLAGLFAVLFIITAVPALLLLSVDRVLLDAGTYKRALLAQSLYQRVPALLAEQLGGTAGIPTVAGVQVPYLSLLSQGDWQVLLAALVPPATLQQTTEAGVDQVFNYLDGASGSAAISLVALKQHLAAPVIEQAIRSVLASHPDCTLQQLTAMATAMFAGSGKLELCNPPEEIRAALIPSVLPAFEAAVAGIPDEVEIIQAAPASVSSTGGGPSGNGPRVMIHTIRVATPLSPVLPLVFLLLMTAFGVRSLRGWLRWWGIPLLIAGLITLEISLAAPAALEWLWMNFIVVRIPSLISSGISAAAHDVLTAVARALSQSLLRDAGIVALLGLATTTISSLIRKKTSGPRHSS